MIFRDFSMCAHTAVSFLFDQNFAEQITTAQAVILTKCVEILVYPNPNAKGSVILFVLSWL